MRFVLLFALLLFTSLLGVSKAASAATWEMASPYGDDDFRSQSAQAFAAAVSNASAGKLTLVVFGNGSLVTAEQIPAALRDNRIPIALFEISALADEMPTLAFSSLPLLAPTYPDALRLWNTARPVVQRLLAARGLMVLYALPAVPASLFSKGAVDSAAGLQRRPVAVDGRWLDALVTAAGGTPVTITSSTPSGPRQTFAGGARAMIVPPSRAIAANAWEFVDNAYDIQASFPLAIVAVNQSAFYALDEESQRALLNAAVEAQNDAWSRSVDTRNRQVGLLDGHNLIVQPAPPLLQQALRHAARSVIDEWRLTAGTDGEAILATFGISPE